MHFFLIMKNLFQTTSSECTLISLLAGRDVAIKTYEELYSKASKHIINGKLVAYCSDQAHSRYANYFLNSLRYRVSNFLFQRWKGSLNWISYLKIYTVRWELFYEGWQAVACYTSWSGRRINTFLGKLSLFLSF